LFKIALNAGHYKGTAGKRCLKKLDKNETREWVLNDRICDKIEQKLKAYEGYQLLRVDDTTGSTDVSLSKRVTKANSWGADFYLSIHHNAGINGGTGGGVVAYTYTKVSDATKDWQKRLYNEIIKKTGLKGNRETPLATANLYECRNTNMPCVLLECGFMDSKTDVPVILTDSFADKVATACVSVIVSKGGLKAKKVEAKPATKTLFKVQVGAFEDKKNAQALVDRLKKDGYNPVIV
jgi:N-acetylmuramoyl-L-alanine amidase